MGKRAPRANSPRANETALIKKIRMDHQPHGRLFRNNVGTGWAGRVIRVPDGVLIRNPRPLRAGLVKGSSDLIGWTEVEITPDMVGRRVAIFTAVEAKTPNDTVREDQANFLTVVANAGGVAREVRETKSGDTITIEWYDERMEE
jgi:hypothetical protein